MGRRCSLTARGSIELSARRKDVSIDTSLPPEIIQANELGFADYMYFSFRLFRRQNIVVVLFLVICSWRSTCVVYVPAIPR